MTTKLFKTDQIVPFCLRSDIGNYGAAVKYGANLVEIMISDYEGKGINEEVSAQMRATAYFLHELLTVITEADAEYQGKPMSKENRQHNWWVLKGVKQELLGDMEVGK